MTPTVEQWAVIREAFEAGTIADKALAREYGTSDTYIQMRAKIEGWKVPENRHAGRTGVQSTDKLAEKLDIPDYLIESVGPSVETSEYNQLIERAKGLANRLLSELEATTTYNDVIIDIIEDETEHDRDGRRRYAMKQAITLSKRAAALREISTVMKVLAPVEDKSSDGAIVPKGKKAKRLAEAEESSSVGIFAVPPKLVVIG